MTDNNLPEQPSEESEDDWSEHLAPRLRDATATGQAYTIEQFAGLSRWVIASLLAVNSGALIAILGTEQLSVSGKLTAGGAFAFGLLCALLTGYANMRNAKKALPSLTRQNAYWTIIAAGGSRREAFEEEMDEEWNKVEKTDLAADAFGWLSFGALIVGLLFSGANLIDPSTSDQSPQKIEITISHD